MKEKAVALVLAGGLGTRMAASRPTVPKPLTPVAGIPLLEINLLRLVDAGVDDIRIAVRREAERIMEAVRGFSGIPPGAVSFIVEREPLGTIGALHELKDVDTSVLALNGDLLSGIDIRALLRAHRASKADLTIATHDEHHRLKLGEVIANSDGRVTDYVEKPVKTYRISSGTYVVEPSVAARVPVRGWLGVPTLVKDAIAAGLVVREHPHAEPWIDVNDEADLRAATEMLMKDPVAFGVDPARVRPA